MSKTPKHSITGFSEYLRYFKALLPGKDKHVIEKRTLQHKFDAEAFEGLSGIQPDELEADMFKLHSQLEQRTKNKRNITPLFIRYAAVVVLIISVGSIIYLANRPGEVVHKLSEHVKVADSLEQIHTPIKHDTVLPEIAFKQDKPENNAKSAPENSSSFSKHEISMPIQDEPDIAENMEVVTSMDNEELATEFIYEEETDAAAIEIDRERTFASEEEPDRNKVEVSYAPKASRMAQAAPGNYSDQIVKASPKEDAGVTRKKAADDMEDVAAVGYGASSLEEQTWLDEPAPRGGELAFRNYIKENVNYELLPEFNIAKNVKLSFTVTANGVLENITVLKSDGEAYEKEAIRLLKNGPEWLPASVNNVPVEKEITIRIKIEAYKK